MSEGYVHGHDGPVSSLVFVWRDVSFFPVFFSLRVVWCNIGGSTEHANKFLVNNVIVPTWLPLLLEGRLRGAKFHVREDIGKEPSSPTRQPICLSTARFRQPARRKNTEGLSQTRSHVAVRSLVALLFFLRVYFRCWFRNRL